MRLRRKDDWVENDIDSDKEDDILSDEPKDDFMDSYNDNYDFGYNDLMGGGMPVMEKHNDLLKELTNFNKYIRDKINGWLGIFWDSEENKYVRDPKISPIMNKKCATWCVDYLKTYTRDNNIITHIGKSEYVNLNEDIIEVLWLNIGTRAEEFGIRNNGDILRICVEMEHAALLVLMGAGDGKYNKLLGTVTNRSESVMLSPQQAYGQNSMDQPGNYMVPKPNFLQKFKSALMGGR